MIETIAAGMLLGALGSLHCVGMCGPIALSLPVVNTSYFSKYIGTLLYNLGRVVTYAALGVVFGLIGQSLVWMGFQQWLSIALGVLLLLIVLLPKRITSRIQFFPGAMGSIRGGIGRLFQTKSYTSLFMIGLLNGLLPCGLVYMAVAGAVATASVVQSSVWMAAFGLGTLPMMWVVAMIGSSLKLRFRTSIRKVYPYMIGVMACLLIVRGMGLGIPFVSPAIETQPNKSAVVTCHDE